MTNNCLIELAPQKHINIRTMRKRIILLLVFFLIFVDCSKNKESEIKENGRTEEALLTESGRNYKSIKFDQKLRIGSDDFEREEYMFGIISDIKIDKDGYIYVLDSPNFRIQKYSPEGKFISSYGKGKGQGPGEFLRPKCIAVDLKNNLYVADMNQCRITVFSPKGKIIKTINTKVQPADIAIGKNEEIFITAFFDFGNYRIYQYNPVTGELEKTFCRGKKETKLVAEAGEAGNLCVDEEGNIYYSFFYPYEIRKFSPNGKLIKRFSRKVEFFRPPQQDKLGIIVSISGSIGLIILPDGIIMNVIRHLDLKNRKAFFFFDVFDKKGEWLFSFPSSEIGSDWIRHITTDSRGDLYLDYIEPYPHIRKYSMDFFDN